MTSINKFSIESKFLKWDINIHLINKKNFDIIMTFDNYYFLIISDYNLSITKIKPSRINFKRLFFIYSRIRLKLSYFFIFFNLYKELRINCLHYKKASQQCLCRFYKWR